MPALKKPVDNTGKILENIALIFQDEEEGKLEKDILKEVLESIVHELKANANRIHEVDTKLVSKYMIFEK